MTKLIGTAPNQTPTNADLGKLAYQDAIAVGTGTAGQLYCNRAGLRVRRLGLRLVQV